MFSRFFAPLRILGELVVFLMALIAIGTAYQALMHYVFHDDNCVVTSTGTYPLLSDPGSSRLFADYDHPLPTDPGYCVDWRGTRYDD